MRIFIVFWLASMSVFAEWRLQLETFETKTLIRLVSTSASAQIAEPLAAIEFRLGLDVISQQADAPAALPPIFIEGLVEGKSLRCEGGSTMQCLLIGLNGDPIPDSQIIGSISTSDPETWQVNVSLSQIKGFGADDEATAVDMEPLTEKVVWKVEAESKPRIFRQKPVPKATQIKTNQ